MFLSPVKVIKMTLVKCACVVCRILNNGRIRPKDEYTYQVPCHSLIVCMQLLLFEYVCSLLL